MEKLNQQQIKWENTRAIFSAIAEAEMISRAELAAKTGLSLMTVGKLVESLDSSGIVEQFKDERVTAGRTARLVRRRPEWHMLVLDLTVPNFRMSVLDSACHVLEEIVYPYEESLFCEENLVLFLRNLPFCQRHKTDPNFCIGAGILLPGAYDAQNDCMIGKNIPIHVPLNPGRILSSLLPDIPLAIMTDVQAAAYSVGLTEDDTEHLLWLSLDLPISGALILDGTPILGAHRGGGRFGDITIGTNFTLREAMLTLKDPTERGAAAAIALFSLISAFDPAVIRLEAHSPGFDPIFLDALHGRLNQLNADRALPLPPIKTEVRSVFTPVLGIALSMRNDWMKTRLE